MVLGLGRVLRADLPARVDALELPTRGCYLILLNNSCAAQVWKTTAARASLASDDGSSQNLVHANLELPDLALHGCLPHGCVGPG